MFKSAFPQIEEQLMLKYIVGYYTCNLHKSFKKSVFSSIWVLPREIAQWRWLR